MQASSEALAAPWACAARGGFGDVMHEACTGILGFRHAKSCAFTTLASSSHACIHLLDPA